MTLPRPTTFLAFCVLSAGLVLPACSGCEEQDDEAQIRAMFKYAVEMAERHDLGELMDLTTDDFKVKGQGLSRRDTKGILLMAFRRYGDFSIKHPAPSVDLGSSGTTATAQAPFLIVREGREAPDLGDLYDDPESWAEEVAEMADLYNIKLWLVKDGTWKVEKAKLDGYRRLENL